MVNFYHVIERRRIPDMAKADDNYLHPWDVFIWFPFNILFVTKRSASSAYKLIHSFYSYLSVHILFLENYSFLLFTANNKLKDIN